MKTLLSGFLAGLAVFIWSLLSWIVLPWHGSHLHAFKNEAAVAEVIKANAPVPGLYLMPDAGFGDSGTDLKGGTARMRAGPFLFGTVRPGKREWSVSRLLVFNFFTQVVGALIITVLVNGARLRDYLGRALYVSTLALAVGILGHLPNYNWWEFPLGWTILNIADLVIGWSFGGLVIAYFTEPPVRRGIYS